MSEKESSDLASIHREERRCLGQGRKFLKVKYRLQVMV